MKLVNFHHNNIQSKLSYEEHAQNYYALNNFIDKKMLKPIFFTGSTAAGLCALENGGLRYTLINALEKATEKCKETSKALK